MEKVLLTGATGFVGRYCLPLLSARGYEVHAVSSKPIEDNPPVAHWHQADLFDASHVTELIARVQPAYLLHLAWYVNPGKWANAEDNIFWVQASLKLLQQFQKLGGRRVVMAGSCAEYDWRYGYCSESVTPTAPTTLYGTCKSAVRSLLSAYSRETGLSSAWGRIFFLYGPHEHPSRLVSSVTRSLLRGEPAHCSHGNQIRDYLYVEDAASAFVALLESNVQGTVNIASGTPVAVKEIVHKIGGKIGRQELIQLGAVPTAAQEPNLLVADVGRLYNEVGWRPHYDLDAGLDQTIDWWRQTTPCCA